MKISSRCFFAILMTLLLAEALQAAEDRQALLSGRVGFGEKTTGGLEGPTVHASA